ncbi:MAG: HEPN domain-containing protein [Armatimonadota bacterium]|nr:HEPN domain-containing protein [Armatimonadota bacterium]
MATWEEISRDGLQAAKVLLAEGHLRSSISRSYYAAYCAVSGQLVKRGVRFAHGWNNPAHEQLPALIRNGLSLPPNARRQLAQAIRRLRLARENADYRPAAFVDRSVAFASLHDAVLVTQALGGEE